jgi:prophage DNA circulation protein
MPWQDRLRDAAYRSPNGTRTVFQYADVSRVVEKKTSAFDFPDADGSLVQDLGHKSRRYPLRLMFSGSDHDIAADAFEQTLLERGAGVLEHPRYGQVDVVPFGEITQRDDLVRSANQTVIDVVFVATIGAVYPAAGVDGVAEAIATVGVYNTAAAQQLSDDVALVTQLDEVTFRDRWETLVDAVAVTLADVADSQADILRQFNDVRDSITRGLSVLVGQPLTLASQTLTLIQIPGRALNQIEQQLNGYADLVRSIIARTPLDSNDLATRQLYAQGALSGLVVSVTAAAQSGGYTTQPQAIAAAETLLNQLDAVTVWADANYAALGAVDTGGAYQQIQTAVSLAAGALVNLAFDLRRERRIVLDRDRSVYDVVGKYYGDIDANLDFFINTNQLTGSEILELPRGRMVVVYG